MRVICIGDLHGNDCWTKVSVSQYDKVIFLGDYADNLKVDNNKILRNLQDVVEIKKSFPEKVVLLLGNHDIHYSAYPNYKSSGFNKDLQPELTKLFEEQVFQVAYQFGNWLFTHAGISNGYFNFLNTVIPDFGFDTVDIAERLNLANTKHNQQKYLHIVGKFRGGNYEMGGITWADKTETEHDYLDGIHQVVGHTKVNDILTLRRNSRSSITYVDVLHSSIKFFERDI